MNETLISLVAFLALTLGGYCFLDLVFKKNVSILIKIGLSFCIGSIIYILTMLALFFLGFELSIIPHTFVFILIFLRWATKASISIPKVKFKFTLIPTTLILLIIFSLSFSIVETHLRPLVAWDGIASWFVGGKSIIVNKTISPEFYTLMKFDFPPAAHLLIAYPSFFLGKFSESSGLILFNFIHISTVILFFAMLRKKMKLNMALLFTFLYASTQNVVRHSGYMDVGHVDIIVSYFILCSVFLVERLFLKADYKTVAIVSFVLALIAITKNEGLPFAVISLIVTVMTLTKNKMYKPILWSLPGIAIILVWYIFKSLFLPVTAVFAFDKPPHFNQLANILFVMCMEILNITRWNLGWIFIIFTIPFWLKKVSLWPIILIGLLQIVVFFIAYFTSFMDPVIHAQSSFDRLILQLYPLFLYVAVVSFMRRNKRQNELQ